jgi:hypothetical protein
MENLGGPSSAPVPMDISNPLIPPQDPKPTDALGLDALLVSQLLQLFMVVAVNTLGSQAGVGL